MSMLKNSSIIEFNCDELKKKVESLGFPAYRGEQLFDWMHKKGVLDPQMMTNLPAALKEQLNTAKDILPCCLGEVLTSSDGTIKAEVCLLDGYKIETVLIPEKDKLTQCISTQVGCSVGCVFCRSGSVGFIRNLTIAEIISQIFLARALYKEKQKLTNVVFMGVGEPLHNYEAVLGALNLICEPRGIALSKRKVTISTSGIIKGIERLGLDTQGKAALAISLHAGTDDIRQSLVPGIKTPLSRIMEVLKKYPLSNRSRFTIEYVLIKGINDTDKDAKNLVRLLNGLKVKVNLLPLNTHDLTHYLPSDEDRIIAFEDILVKKGISVFKRKRRGEDIGAACGQLLGTRNNFKN